MGAFLDRLRGVPFLQTTVRRLRWFGFRHRCSCCGSWLRRFVPHITDLEMRWQSICPVCQCKPVHRRGALFLRELAREDRQRGRVLHIAPEGGLKRIIQAEFADSYVSADIAPGKAQVRSDIAKLPFAEGSFGLLYCCHVLPVVPGHALESAISECFRVLGPGGVAIIEDPVREGRTLDMEQEPESARVAIFYNGEILRMFGDEDYWQMFERAGFRIRRDKVYSPALCERFGLYGACQAYLVKEAA